MIYGDERERRWGSWQILMETGLYDITLIDVWVFINQEHPPPSQVDDRWCISFIL